MRCLWLWGGLLFLCLSGCNCEDTGNIGRVGELAALPPTLNFDAKEGETQTKRVEVIAKQGQIRVDAIDVIQGKSYFSIKPSSMPTLPLDLEEGDSFALEVIYQAKQGAAPSGKIQVSSSAQVPNEGKLDIFLLTKSNEQLLVFQPDPVDFGAIERGAEKVIEAVGTNRGRADLVIQKIEVDPSTSQQFSFPDGLPKAPLTVGPGETLKVKIKYKAATNKIDRGALLLTCEGGCAPSSPDPAKRVNPFRLPLIATVGTSSIEVTPKQLDFGFVSVGAVKEGRVKVTNKGQAPLRLSKIALKPLSSGAFLFGALKDVEVAPGETKEVVVSFRPNTTEEHKGALQFMSNDPASPLVEVLLRGRVTAPNIEVKPTRLDFGKAPVTVKLDINILNTGDMPLKVDPATFAPGSSKAFAFPNAPQALTIQPNSAVPLRVSYSPTSMNPDNGKVLLASNDPDTPVLEVPLSGLGQSPQVCDLVGRPAQVQYGLALIGKSVTKDVELYNQGAKECTLESLRVYMTRPTFPPYLGPEVFVLSAPPQGCNNGVCNPPLTIKPGNAVKARVAFSPASAKQHLTDPAFRGFLETTTTTGTPKVRKIPLEGVPTHPCISVVPETLNVGLVKTGCSSRNETITIYNGCPAALGINKIAFSGAANGFVITQAPKTPFAIASGKEATIVVKYQATAPPRQQQAILHIEHGFVQASPLVVTLSGEGTDKDEQTDTFKQPQGAQADVLFVIDNSASMGEEQSYLGKNITLLLDWAVTVNADFHMGVTTTELVPNGNFQPGELRGNPKIMTSQTPHLGSAFAYAARVGTGGGSQEAGLEAARAALSPKMLQGPNKGFLRKDASLSIIVISDEPDQSPLHPQFYTAFFKGLKGGPRSELFRFHAVIGYDLKSKQGVCGVVSSGTRPSSSGRYLSVVNDTKGVVASICNQAWASVLKQISLLTFAQKKQFFLSRPADPKSIQVKVDGKVLAAGSSTWTYEATSNAIEFAQAPAPNATIVVTYKAICF